MWRHIQPERETLSGAPHETAASEKLNDERGVEPLRVSRIRDGAEPVQAGSGRVGRSFCILPPEIVVAGSDGAKHAGDGGSRRARPCEGLRGPADVTDPEKCSDNRGRTSGAGMAAGAGRVRLVLQSPKSGRVP